VPDDAGYAVEHVLTAAVAVDLAESLDTRESASGTRVLEAATFGGVRHDLERLG
jgi:hypothetical protein